MALQLRNICFALLPCLPPQQPLLLFCHGSCLLSHPLFDEWVVCSGQWRGITTTSTALLQAWQLQVRLQQQGVDFHESSVSRR